MCFSATASFVASAGLGVIGVASLKKVTDSHQKPLASIPLIFAVQQFAEGLVWLSLTREGWEGFHYPASYAFLTVAQVIWPILFPVAFMFFETDPKRKKWLQLFILPGLIVAFYFLGILIFRGMDVRAEGHHVFYDIDFPKRLIPFAAGFYLAATVFPPILSPDLRIKAIGAILLVSYLVARIFFQPSLISVWCFFAIVVSILMYLVIKSGQKELNM
jgi:uncharacterized membrane protein